ncbi:MAG: hypothetical protein ABR578_05805 [Chromatocurvus sp.]
MNPPSLITLMEFCASPWTAQDSIDRGQALMVPFQVAHLNAMQGFRGSVNQLEDMMRTVGREARPDYPWDDALISSIHASLTGHTAIEDISERQSVRERNLLRLRRGWRICRTPKEQWRPSTLAPAAPPSGLRHIEQNTPQLPSLTLCWQRNASWSARARKCERFARSELPWPIDENSPPS